VCPWNARSHSQKAGRHDLPPADLTRRELINPALAWLAALTPTEFNRQFRDSPIKRTKRNGLLRNIAIAMGNSEEQEFLPQLEEWAGAEAEDPVLAEAAAWALARLTPESQ
ncbi:MAG TPA: tRNA epoxyqueuosine(34) reductase QueG, partial [Acidobacteriaceae bacterium]